MNTYDVAIVGGALAGCSAAIHLARHGFSVAIFEAKAYPHHKVCGEFLSPECEVMLNELGVMADLDSLLKRIDTAEITAPDGTTWTTRFPGEALGITRYRLDHVLAEHAAHAGVSVFEKSPVSAIEGGLADGFTLHTPNAAFHTRAVIAAYGKRSNLDRTLNRPFLNKPQPFVALKNHFIGPALPRRIELHVFPGGYCGMSEVEDGLTNVCLLVRQDTFQKHSGSPKIEDFIRWMMTQNPRLQQWLEQAQQVHSQWLSIAQVPFVRKEVIHNDIVMTGDAAGLITPLAGNGMSMALHGGKLAACYVGDYLRGDVTALDAYALHWQKTFGGRLRMGRFLQMFMLRPAILSPGLKLINAIPLLGQYFVNQTRS
ncbi:MAG: NAD(P)/FAD-dependent oxidoreductase [Chloroflexi bacterium]|nr:NAD(P)/FAD-dependent oxidoreductase [Chloroflexota bacterium]